MFKCHFVGGMFVHTVCVCDSAQFNPIKLTNELSWLNEFILTAQNTKIQTCTNTHTHTLTSRDGAYNDRPLAARDEAEALSWVALDGDLSN